MAKRRNTSNWLTIPLALSLGLAGALVAGACDESGGSDDVDLPACGNFSAGECDACNQVMGGASCCATAPACRVVDCVRSDGRAVDACVQR